MADSDILKQIALLNPRIINGNDSVNDFIENSETSSPQEDNQNEIIGTPNTEEDNDILNLWSSTKIFFDPYEPTKINPNSQNPDDKFSKDDKLTEREFDRQRYLSFKQQRQKIYVNRGRFTNNETGGHDILHLGDIPESQLRQFLQNRDNAQLLENNLLQASTSSATPTQPIATSQGFMSNPMDNDSKLNPSTLSPEDKDKDLYSHLLDSISPEKRKTGKKSESDAILSKTNDSRSREIAEKKKRRSAATMRCRERKKNQLQKKEQYIKYLENQILFLNGSILHMSNEITWLRRSFLDQYGEQSLKEIYMKNGMKDVNFSNLLYPGSSPSPSSFGNSNLLSPEPSLHSSPGLSPGKNLDNKNSPLLPQHTQYMTPVSSTGTSNTSLISHYSPPLSTNGSKDSKSSTSSLVQPQSSSDMIIGSFPAASPSTTTVTPSSNTSTTSNPTASDLFQHLDIATLNEFANLSKEQRDVLLKILEKQKELSSEKDEEPVPPAASRNFINIAHDQESQPQNFVPNNTSTTAGPNISSFNLIPSFNGQNDLQGLSFHSNSMAVAASHPSSLPLQTSQSIPLTLNTFNAQPTTEKDNPQTVITTTTTDTQNAEYINLENLIYYI